jgi:MGT family glycosyltransferase
MRPVSYAGSGDLPRSVKDDGSGRLFAYVTLGTIYGAAELLREVIAGLVELDMRVLVATGPSVDPAELGAQPESVSLEQWVPQARVWPYVDLAVHHGGSGTMLGALAGGVRQLVIPQAADQPSNARAMTKAGAGLFMAPERVTAQAVAEYAGLVLATESFAVETRRLRAEIEAMPGPDELAKRLPDLV